MDFMEIGGLAVWKKKTTRLYMAKFENFYLNVHYLKDTKMSTDIHVSL
jgi:hypothetical protein